MFIPVVLLVGTIATIYFLSRSKGKKLPPGPFRLPILGHLPFLGKLPSRTLLQWSKRYGPILSVKLGSFDSIVINDSKLIRKAFSLASFSGRPDLKITNEVSGNRRGMGNCDGPKAAEQRKYIQKLLRDFGYGSKSMESRILDEVPFLLQVFENHLTKPLNVKHTFGHNIISVLWSIVAGEIVDRNDEGIQKLAMNITKAAEMSTVIEKLAVFLKFIPEYFPEISGLNKKLKGMLEIQKYLDFVIEEHRRTKVADCPRDIIDAYLDEVEKTTDPESSFIASYGNITFAIQDLFVAGIESTTSMLEWILFYLVKQPNVQEKLQKEIDLVLEGRSSPSSYDRPKMPYVEAVIQEALRAASVLPLALIHSALEDTEFSGYSIPKGMAVVGNLYGANHNEGTWGDPDVFRPERFLDKEGKFVKNDDVLTFSWGKRSCIGENLARLQLFFYTVSIFQRFSVKPVGQLPSQNGIFGFSLTVHPFQVYVSKRE